MTLVIKVVLYPGSLWRTCIARNCMASRPSCSRRPRGTRKDRRISRRGFLAARRPRRGIRRAFGGAGRACSAAGNPRRNIRRAFALGENGFRSSGLGSALRGGRSPPPREDLPHGLDRIRLGRCLVLAVALDAGEAEGHAAGVLRALL